MADTTTPAAADTVPAAPAAPAVDLNGAPPAGTAAGTTPGGAPASAPSSIPPPAVAPTGSAPPGFRSESGGFRSESGSGFRSDRGPRREGGSRGGGGGGGRDFRTRRKVCIFCVEKVKDIDYKDTSRLRRFISERGKIDPRRKTGTCAKHQRRLSVALKRARFMALLPYTGEHIRSVERAGAAERAERAPMERAPMGDRFSVGNRTPTDRPPISVPAAASAASAASAAPAVPAASAADPAAVDVAVAAPVAAPVSVPAAEPTPQAAPA